LRAVADLIDDHPGLRLPSVSVHYILSTAESTPDQVTGIAAALPCQWHADLDGASERGWVDLTATTGGPVASVHGMTVTISAKAEVACVPTGTKTVTTWAPQPALARLLAGDGTPAGRP
jgi:hypothetical protein